MARSIQPSGFIEQRQQSVETDRGAVKRREIVVQHDHILLLKRYARPRPVLAAPAAGASLQGPRRPESGDASTRRKGREAAEAAKTVGSKATRSTRSTSGVAQGAGRSVYPTRRLARLAREHKDRTMKRAFSRTAIALIALGVVFAAHAVRAEDDKTPKPLPPQQKNFPLDQTWSLRDSMANRSILRSTSASRSTARCAARATPAAIPGRRRCIRSRTSTC